MLAARASAREEEEEEEVEEEGFSLLAREGEAGANACSSSLELNFSASLDNSAWTSCFEAALAACFPPWPSKTPKTWIVAWVEVPVLFSRVYGKREISGE